MTRKLKLTHLTALRGITRELTANGEVPAIFEGTFEHGGVLVRVDILHRRCDGRLRLIEVKSTTDEARDHRQPPTESRECEDAGRNTLGQRTAARADITGLANLLK